MQQPTIYNLPEWVQGNSKRSFVISLKYPNDTFVNTDNSIVSLKIYNNLGGLSLNLNTLNSGITVLATGVIQVNAINKVSIELGTYLYNLEIFKDGVTTIYVTGSIKVVKVPKKGCGGEESGNGCGGDINVYVDYNPSLEGYDTSIEVDEKILVETNRAIAVESTKANLSDVINDIEILYSDLNTNKQSYTNIDFANKRASLLYYNPNGLQKKYIDFDEDGIAQLGFLADPDFNGTLSVISVASGDFLTKEEGISILDLSPSGIFKIIDAPYDKSAVVFPANQFMDNINFWGANSAKITKDLSQLKFVKISSNTAGVIVIGFCVIIAGVATLVHTKEINIPYAGIHSLTPSDLEIPDISMYQEVQVVIRNNSSVNRAASYKIATNADNFYFPLAGGAVVPVSGFEVSYWIELKTTSFDLPTKVNGANSYSQLRDQLANSNYAFMGEGTHIITSNLELKNGQQIIGKGARTILQAGSGVTKVINPKPSQQKCIISNLTIKGVSTKPDTASSSVLPTAASADTNTGIGTNYGIYSEADDLILDKLWIEGFNADAIHLKSVDINPNNYPSGVSVNNILAKDSYRGINIDALCEYSRFSNISVRDCLIGATYKGGNNNLINSQFTDNRLGFHISGADTPNECHGLISNVSANHNILLGLYAKDVRNGQSLNNFTVFFGGVEIDGCEGINWCNGQIGSVNVIVKNSVGRNSIRGLAFNGNTYRFITTDNNIVQPHLKDNFFITSDGNDNLINN